MKKCICILLLIFYAFGICIAQEDVQIINSTLLRNRYPAITVRQGIPVH